MSGIITLSRNVPFWQTSQVWAIVAALFVASASLPGFAQDEPDQKDARPREVKMGLRIKMPGKSFKGPLPELSADQTRLRDELKADLEKLAGEIGERNLSKPNAYQDAIEFLHGEFQKAGYKPQHQSFRVKGQACFNLIAEVAGTQRAKEIVVIGAHYDSVIGTAGANDNGSGAVAVLALARHFARAKPQRTLRFVLFANEEPPYFQTRDMGSLVYARRCKAQKDKVVGMLSLETIGYYTDEKNSQNYPPPFNLLYPSTGNFVAFVGNLKSGDLVSRCCGSFRKHAKFPSEGGAVPAQIQGIGWSDHWSFWQAGYPALMVTDTAPFRYPHYHLASDTPDKVNYDCMARVVSGLQGVIKDLVNPPTAGDPKKIKKFK